MKAAHYNSIKALRLLVEAPGLDPNKAMVRPILPLCARVCVSTYLRVRACALSYVCGWVKLCVLTCVYVGVYLYACVSGHVFVFLCLSGR